MSTPGSPRIRKEAIYAAAARLFREKGYPATSMRELAAEVGLEASSLYSHIRSKGELLDHICFAAARAFTEGMEQVRSSHDQQPVEQIGALIALHIRIAHEDPASQTVFNNEWRHLAPDRLRAFLDLRKAYEQQFQDIIEEGQATGVLRPMSPVTMLSTLLSAMRWVYTDRRASRMDQEEVARAIRRMLLEGIMVPPGQQ